MRRVEISALSGYFKRTAGKSGPEVRTGDEISGILEPRSAPLQGNCIRHRRHAGVRSAAAARSGGAARLGPRRRNSALLSHQRRRPYDGAEVLLPLPRRTPRPPGGVHLLPRGARHRGRGERLARTHLLRHRQSRHHPLSPARARSGLHRPLRRGHHGRGALRLARQLGGGGELLPPPPGAAVHRAQSRPLLAGPGLRRHLHRRRRAGALH